MMLDVPSNNNYYKDQLLLLIHNCFFDFDLITPDNRFLLEYCCTRRDCYLGLRKSPLYFLKQDFLFFETNVTENNLQSLLKAEENFIYPS